MSDKVFNQNLHLLANIFGKEDIAKREERLREIFHSTETTWQLNLDKLKNKKVENILIAEAAPWSDAGVPRYFYNQIESNYHLRIWRTFFPDTSIPFDKEKTYRMLADKNFLLIDTIPFSMRYSGKRNHKYYNEIIANSIEWWTNKLKNDKLSFTKKVNIAFAFKVNGFSIIKSLNGVLKLKDGQEIKLTDDLIAADGSGYTNSDKLRIIFKCPHF